MKRVVPFLILPGLFLIGFAGSWFAGRAASDRITSEWAERSAALRRDAAVELSSAFAAFQEGLRLQAQEAAVGILTLRRGGAGEPERAPLFALLAKTAGAGVTLEYYDRQGELLAWTGPAGSERDTALDARTPLSYIAEGPIHSRLVVVVPVISSGEAVGRIVGKRTFADRYPASLGAPGGGSAEAGFRPPAFDSPGPGIEYRIPDRSAGGGPSLSEGGNDAGVGPGGSIVPLKGLSGADIAYAIVPDPSRAEVLASESANWSRWGSLAAAGFLVSMIGSAWRAFRTELTGPWHRLGLIATLWIARYALLALDVPGELNPLGLFDPSLFASQFAGGAAGSPGDLVITAALLAFTVGVLLKGSLRAYDAGETAGGPRAPAGPLGKAVAAVWIVAVIGLIGPLTRGFHAVVRSIVFDSKVDLNDPKLVYPDLPAAALLVAALLLVVSMLFAGMAFLSHARAIAARRLFRGPRTAWGFVLLLAAASSIGFDLIHPNPLGTPLQRLLIVGVIAWLAAFAAWRGAASSGAGRLGTVFLVFLLAAAGMIPVLDGRIHDHDKTMVEAAVRDLARPEDGWMTVLLDNSLTALADRTSAEVLGSGDAMSTGRLAFGAWARSPLSGEGNTCSVTFVDREGTVVSHFHVGPAPHWSREVPMDEMPRSTRFTGRESKTLAGRSVPWYRGYAPVFDADSTFVGGVWTGIAPKDPARVFGQGADPLSLAQRPGTRTPARKIIIAEYEGGRMTSASDDDLPVGRPIPPEVMAAPLTTDGRWITETIGGEEYETYYYPAREGGAWGASLEALDAGWHFYSYSRYILFYGSLLLACAAVWGAARMFRGGRWRLPFRARLVAAFAVVSVIPVVLLAWYNRQSLQSEAERATDEFLRSETGLVLNEIEGRIGMAVPYEIGRLHDETLEEIGGLLNTQAFLYDGAGLRASSRPDLHAAELIDGRLPGDAFAAIFLEGRNFHAGARSAGSLSYLVGYRAIRSPSGEAVGAVATPALSRQETLEEDLARRDVILYGIYILVLSAALLAGRALAGQIARPVQRLTLAARQVATGDLDVRLETGRKDELGELETAFQGMTSDLRKIQERMVAVERELAWKEMAKQVAHEIKNPLTPMRLSVQHLVSSYRKGAADFAEILETVSTTLLEQIEALSRIASEFSSFARLPERRVGFCPVHEVIDEAAALFHREGVRFASAYAPGAPAVRADREELRRAFINIFRNSVQASGDEVSIGVTTRMEGAHLVIAVTDTGPGMSPEVRARLFEPNFSTKTDGMGIGLTIVKKTIEDLDGTIDVESAPGRGTTVRIRLPVAEDRNG